MQQVEVVLLGMLVILVQMGMEEALIFMVMMAVLWDWLVEQLLQILVLVVVEAVKPIRMVVLAVQE